MKQQDIKELTMQVNEPPTNRDSVTMFLVSPSKFYNIFSQPVQKCAPT
jgi:hypothetical protein